jgi:hypothetical protein
MFKIRLSILLMFSTVFIGSINCETNSKCKYLQNKEYYECQVSGQNIRKEHETILFSGDHLKENDDDSVNKLAFSKSTINYIPTNLFAKFNNLKWFECDACYLKKIEKADFKNAGNLEILRLKFGEIEKIQNDTFYYCPELKNLGLRSNIISRIELNAFAGLRRLEVLFLNHNHIENLTPGTFDDLTSLKSLALDDNRIETLKADLFKFNIKLKKIFVNNNQIAVLDPNLISHLDKLNYIDFRYNDCGDREEFFDSRPARIQSTFNKFAPQCTEEDQYEYDEDYDEDSEGST